MAERTGDTDALIRLKVACDLAIDAAQELGRPLPAGLIDQIRELCDVVQRELESRDERFKQLGR